MPTSKHILFAVVIRGFAWQVALASLLLAVSASGVFAQSAPPEVEVGLQENAAPGTVVIELGERFPNLRNFRQAERSRTSSFRVDPETGRVTVRDSAHLNFERRSTLLLNLQADLDVAARDPFLEEFAESLKEEGVSSRKLGRMIPSVQSLAVRVLLKDTPESPRLADLRVFLHDTAQAGTTLAALTAVDQDHNETFVFQIVDGNEQSMFELDADSGILSLQTSELLNAETHPVHLLKVRVTDKDGLTALATAEIHVRRTETVSAVEVPAEPERISEMSASEAGSEESENIPVHPVDSTLRSVPENAVAENRENESLSDGTLPDRSGSAGSTFDSSSGSEQGSVPLPPQSDVEKAGRVADPESTADVRVSGDGVPADSGTADRSLPNDDAGTTGEASKPRPNDPQDSEHLSTQIANGGGKARLLKNSVDRKSTNPAGAAESTKAVSADHPRSDLLRDLSVLSVAFTVIGLTIFFLYRRAFEARREALKHKEEDDARVKAAEALLKMEEESPADEVSDPECPTEQSDTDNEEPEANELSRIPETISSMDDSGPFDPESLVDETFFTETPEVIRQRAEDCQSLSERSLLSDLDSISEMLDELGQPRAAAEFSRMESLARIESTVTGEVLAKSDLADSSRETAPPVRHSFGVPDRESSEILPSRRRRDSQDELDGYGTWNDRPDHSADHRRSFDSDKWDAPRNESQQRSWDSEADFPNADSGTVKEETSSESLQPDSEVLTGDSVAGDAKIPSESGGVSNRVASLRNELADLFAIHSRQTVAQPETPEPVLSPVLEEVSGEEKSGERTSEESHLDSVAQYLSQLLERSRKEEAEEAIFVDRRKSSGKAGGKWDGVDRRAGAQKPKPQVKSYIETYLSEHGGQLAPPPSPPAVVAAEPEAETSAPAVVRAPVDVQTIRLHMNSFREVATVSVEHALASYKIRQARGNLAGRTVLMIGLVVIVTLAVATNSVARQHLSSLNWMMGTIVCLIVAEIFLRLQSIRRHRKELKTRLMESQKMAGSPEKSAAGGQSPA